MKDKLESIAASFQNLQEQMSDPAIMSDMERYKKVNQKYKELEPIVAKYQVYKKMQDDITGNKELLNDKSTDSELREMAQLELDELEEKLPEIEEELKLLLVPKDPNDSHNAIMEIRAGTGGDEAGIFAGDLLRMYKKYFEYRGWNYEIQSLSESEKGGFKEVVISVTGDEVYGVLKFESGVHRVQRVPETEAQGRVHTSAATVAVLLESDDIEIEINENDLKIDVYRSSGNGGQSVNTTDSAVRITHLPSGIVVTCQDEKSQLKNKQKAMKHLKAKLYDIELEKQNAKMKSERQSMVGSGDRSAKIRTYNYPQGRCTDHRINFTSYNLDKVMDGDLYEFTEQLQIADRAQKMAIQE
ncbi:MAG: peptide chain release factor 1 [Calditrichaeota bacterium]|nr:peptide chain release factor 1 [Calditrichota bacterium]